jgi:hypothetical protein
MDIIDILIVIFIIVIIILLYNNSFRKEKLETNNKFYMKIGDKYIYVYENNSILVDSKKMAYQFEQIKIMPNKPKIHLYVHSPIGKLFVGIKDDKLIGNKNIFINYQDLEFTFDTYSRLFIKKDDINYYITNNLTISENIDDAAIITTEYI